MDALDLRPKILKWLNIPPGPKVIEIEGMIDERFVRTYRKLDTQSSMGQDAEAAFGQIVPHIEERYPIVFDGSLQKDSIRGEYYLVGSYIGRGWFGLRTEKLVTLKWGPRDRGPEGHQLFSPVIQFDDPWGYEFTSFESLDDLLNENVRLPKEK